MLNSLLPPNATRLERALEHGARPEPIATPVDAIDDPLTCPAYLLPWLAYGLSVDSWDADWSEADKRAAVAGSLELHRMKGTRASVDTVLARFDQLARVIEWHETAPRGAPHTFDVVVPMVLADGTAPGGRRSSATFAEAIIREIGRVKPLREHMRLIQQVDATGSVAIQAVARVLLWVREDAVMTIDTSPDWAAWLQTEDGEPLQTPAGDFLDTRP